MKLFALAVLIALPALSACNRNVPETSTPRAAGNITATPVDSPAPSEKRKKIDFGLANIPRGLPYEEVLKKLGRPLKLKKIKRGEHCGDGLNKILEYPGLTLEFIYDSESGYYSVFSIEITSEKWMMIPGFAIGDDIDKVLAKTGEPTTRLEEGPFLVFRYEPETYTHIAVLYFSNGKLTKARFGYRDCLQ
jgi:hypothetical protein